MHTRCRLQPQPATRVLAVLLCSLAACDNGAPAAKPPDAGKPKPHDAALPDAEPEPSGPAQLRVRVIDPETGSPIACKLLLEATPAGRTPSFGTAGIGEWLSENVLGVLDTLYGDPCEFTLPFGSGPLRLTATQGFERERASADVLLHPGRTTEVVLELPRALDTRGYACADFHVHSAPSFDSDVPLDQRLISALGEGLDAFAPTDHDAVVDWQAELARLHMADRLTVILGDEVTSDGWAMQPMGHFGVFPIPLDADLSSYQLRWQTPVALLERLDALFPDAVIQVNHPRWDTVIGFLTANAFDPLDPKLGARLGLSHVDAIELWNTNELDSGGGIGLEAMLEDYYKLLDLGFPVVATGNSDTHELSRQPLGYPRNCIRVPDDSPGGLTGAAVIDGLSAGRTFVTSGPWLEVTLAGHGPGDMLARPAQPELEVLLDAASWVPVDRLHVVVNGKTQITLDVGELPARFTVPLDLPQASSYIMALVEGDAPLPVHAGTRGPVRSAAFSNPIWVLPGL
ncbi:MAG TPA: CehA/McbA family metallohydrolase [Polyangiales bacterium]|nr:CehA/McbA family metallohydrolase [Polyangiales bacterium]